MRQSVLQTYQRDSQACDAAFAQTKQQLDDQFKKEQRRAKKSKEETGWHAFAVYEGSRDEAIKGRRVTEADWGTAIEVLLYRQQEAKHLLRRCGRLANATPEEEATILAARAAEPVVAPPPESETTTEGDEPAAAPRHPPATTRCRAFSATWPRSRTNWSPSMR